jgi:hypothetical protein
MQRGAPSYAEYVVDPGRETHLVRMHADRRTLCGKDVGRTWEHGDDTVSGIAATCARCKDTFLPRPEQ